MVRAVRGATSVSEDSTEAILASTSELLTEVLGRNALATDDLISIIFTVHPGPDGRVPRRRGPRGRPHQHPAAVRQ